MRSKQLWVSKKKLRMRKLLPKARDAAIDFRDERIKEKTAADNAVPLAKKFMEDEINRVNSEHETLLKVQRILEGLLPKEEIQMNSRKLLSRMATLLSNPSFP